MELLENLKEKIDSLSEHVSSFYEENKKLSYLILGLVFIILICLILLAANSKKTDEKNVIPGARLELTDPLITPNGPELPRDYNISRQTKEKWTTEEAEIWFTVPTETEIDALATANENMVNEIIGAAP